MAITYIKATVFKKNTEMYWDVPRGTDLPCRLVQRGIEYFQPVLQQGVLVGYTPRRDNGIDALPTDVVKTLRLYDPETTDTYWVMAAPGTTEATWADNCNECCGTTPDLSYSTIPTPIAEVIGCPDATTGNYVFKIALPTITVTNPFSLKTFVNFTYNGGSTPATPFTAGGVTGHAAVLSFVQANWTGLGTWSLETATNGVKVLVLTGTVVRSAYLAASLVAASYCLTIPSSGYDIGILTVKDQANADFAITIPATAMTYANQEGLAARLRQYLIGTIAVREDSGVHYIQYTGLQKPVRVAKADASSPVSFAAGVCF